MSGMGSNVKNQYRDKIMFGVVKTLKTILAVFTYSTRTWTTMGSLGSSPRQLGNLDQSPKYFYNLIAIK